MILKNSFPIPTNSFNAVYQLVHVFRLLMGRGVMSNVEIMHQLKRFGLDKFASAVMYVQKEVLRLCSAQALWRTFI